LPLSPYPAAEDVLAAIGYGAEMSRQRIVPIPLNHVA
jgi:hypothetical protein